MKSIAEQTESGRVLVSDGAWGTALQKLGLKPGECPELWCVERPGDVRDLARSFINAGSDMVETNSFGANRFKLRHFGLADRAAELNERAAGLSREAAGPDRHVLASIGPTGAILMMGDVSETEIYDAFAEQAAALERGGASACCIETMSAIDEAALAIRAATENTKLEIICTFTFDRTAQGDYRTMMGVSPEQAATEAVAAGARITGANCGNGMEQMIEIVERMKRAVPDTPLLVHANAGLPVNIGGQTVFPESPDMTAEWVERVVDAGAGIIGGCCGTTPEHISAIAKVTDRINSRRKDG